MELNLMHHNGNRKYDYNYVKKFFEESGCLLLSKSYNNTKQKLKYICVCGNDKAETAFQQFKKGVRCILCGIKKGTGNRKHKIEEVRRMFEKEGCILISDKFENVKEPLEYICSCGNPSNITLDNFKQGRRCYECGKKRQIESQKHDYSFVEEYFSSHGCKLISKEYVNYHEKLNYICECGNESAITFSGFVGGQRCWGCGRKKIAESHRQTYNFVYNYFKENNCLLLSETYENAHQHLDYICECGKKSKIKFDKFKIGQRCAECGDLKNKGKNHWHYNEKITDEEREIRRTLPEYKIWVYSIFIRDEYTCQCCGQLGGSLHAHHKDGYSWCIDRRTDISNGVTLCEYCHRDFHSIYGNRNNTEEQWKEYIENIYLENPIFELV